MMRLCSSLMTLSAMSLARGFPCHPILSSATERKKKKRRQAQTPRSGPKKIIHVFQKRRKDNLRTRSEDCVPPLILFMDVQLQMHVCSAITTVFFFFYLLVSLLPTHMITCLIPPCCYDNTSTIGGCCECVLHILRDYLSAVANTLICCWDYRRLGPLRTDNQTPTGS